MRQRPKFFVFWSGRWESNPRPKLGKLGTKNWKRLTWQHLAGQGRNQKMNQVRPDSIEIGDDADREELG